MNVAAICIVSAGVASALHAGKLPPAMPLLREQFGMSLVEVSLMVSLFQVVGMCLGIVGGMFADRFGARRVMAAGLALLGLASLAATASGDARVLLGSRVLESAGFVLAVLPGTVLLRREVPARALPLWLGVWGAYMPTGMAIALLSGPWLIAHGGWRGAWAAVGVATLAVAAWLRFAVAPDGAGGAARADMRALIVDTLRVPGPWLLALGFGCYAAQWMSVFSFLPSIYQAAGIAPEVAGFLTAFAVTINVAGNIGSGWLVHRGVRPASIVVVAALAMGGTAWLAFGLSAPFAVQYVAVVAFSVLGGLIPGTSFVIAPRLAPHAGAVSTTVGLMQQGSMIGQFVAPPVLALVASGADGWAGIWRATAVFALGNLVSGLLLRRVLRERRAGARA